MTSEQVAETLAERFGASRVSPLPDSLAVVVVGMDDGQPVGEHLLVPFDGIGTRIATDREVRRAEHFATFETDTLCVECAQPSRGYRRCGPCSLVKYGVA